MIEQKLIIIKKFNAGPDNQDLKDHILYLTTDLINIIDLEDVLLIDTLFQCYSINTPIADQLSTKPDGTLDYMLMKCAAVIGDTFDLLTLSKINPFKDVIKAEHLKSILQKLI